MLSRPGNPNLMISEVRPRPFSGSGGISARDRPELEVVVNAVAADNMADLGRPGSLIPSVLWVATSRPRSLSRITPETRPRPPLASTILNFDMWSQLLFTNIALYTL